MSPLTRQNELSRRPYPTVRRRRIRSWRGLAWCPIAVALAVGGTASALQGAPVTTMDLAQRIGRAAIAGLTVTEVTVVGRERTAADLVLDTIGIGRGDPILTFDLGAARARLESIAWVARADVSRRLPGRIHVRLTERHPFALWQRDGEVEVIDREGVVLASGNVGRFASLPVLVGVSAAGNAGSLFDLLAARPKLFARVRAAVWVSDRRWNVHFDNGAIAMLPEVGGREAWYRLADLAESQGALDRDFESIDLRLSDRVFVRMRPEIAARLLQPAEDA
jgi:cell division protein FtsQ